MEIVNSDFAVVQTQPVTRVQLADLAPNPLVQIVPTGVPQESGIELDSFEKSLIDVVFEDDPDAAHAQLNAAQKAQYSALVQNTDPTQDFEPFQNDQIIHFTPDFQNRLDNNFNPYIVLEVDLPAGSDPRPLNISFSIPSLLTDIFSSEALTVVDGTGSSTVFANIANEAALYASSLTRLGIIQTIV